MKHTPGPWKQYAPEIWNEARTARVVDQSYRYVEGGKGYLAGDGGFGLAGYIREEDARILAAAPEMFVALAKLICPECSHELQHHADKYGCEVDRGDGYRAGSEIEQALGPCGCNEDDLRNDYPDFVRAIAAFKKARGE